MHIKCMNNHELMAPILTLKEFNQGYVSAPLFFNFYINDILQIFIKYESIPHSDFASQINSHFSIC